MNEFNFSTLEKQAVLRALDLVILADGRIDDGEMAYLTQLGVVLGFDHTFVQEARQLSLLSMSLILREMGEQKKGAMAIMIIEMAKADGEFSEVENKVINEIYRLADFDLSKYLEPQNESSRQAIQEIDLDDIYFVSSDHLRFENGMHVSGPHDGGARRAVKIEPNINGREGYSVTVFNLDSNHPIWGNNVQMAPKPMKVIKKEDKNVVLRGYGADPRAFGDPAGAFENYGISISHEQGRLTKIILHMHDRKIDIEYLP